MLIRVVATRLAAWFGFSRAFNQWAGEDGDTLGFVPYATGWMVPGADQPA